LVPIGHSVVGGYTLDYITYDGTRPLSNGAWVTSGSDQGLTRSRVKQRRGAWPIKLVEWSGGAAGLDQWPPLCLPFRALWQMAIRSCPQFLHPLCSFRTAGFPRLEASLIILRPSAPVPGCV
jgi:hypothetical protein